MPKLQSGDQAPDFTAKTHDGKVIRLADFLGKQGLVLFFYPKDGTPICTQEACAFRDSYEKFVEAGFQVLGVSRDSAERHQQFINEHRLPFPLVSDEDGSLSRAFGVSKGMGLLPGRSTFVIDSDGVVQMAYSAQFASEGHVQQALAALH